MEKQRIFIDMDGTLAVWQREKSMEEVCSPGYFLDLRPIDNMIFAAKKLLRDETKEIYVLSHVLSSRAEDEKNKWLDTYLPEIDRKHRIFVPCEQKKEDNLPGGKRCKDVLLDDYTKNLKEWNGIGIKVLNGINGTKGTWGGRVVSTNTEPDLLSRSIIALSLL